MLWAAGMFGVLAPVLLLVALSTPAPPLPSLVVLTLAAESGVEPSTTRLLTDVLQQELLATRRFSRVVSSRELEGVMGLEAQRQLLQCSDGSCVAEVAGSLGVDLLLNGAVGKLGDTLLLTLRLVDARTGVLKASQSTKLKQGSEALLIDAIRPVLLQLLENAHVTASVAQETQGSGNGKRMLGAGLLLGAGVLAVAGVFLVVAGVAGVVVPKLIHIPTTGLPWQARFALMPGGGLAALGLAAAGVVGAAVLAASGGGLLAASLGAE